MKVVSPARISVAIVLPRARMQNTRSRKLSTMTKRRRVGLSANRTWRGAAQSLCTPARLGHRRPDRRTSRTHEAEHATLLFAARPRTRNQGKNVRAQRRQEERAELQVSGQNLHPTVMPTKRQGKARTRRVDDRGRRGRPLLRCNGGLREFQNTTGVGRPLRPTLARERLPLPGIFRALLSRGVCLLGNMLSLLVAPAGWGSSNDFECPGSPAYVHASARVQALASATCDDVRAEMLARVGGQFDTWHDPHNNGTYSSNTSASPAALSFSRLTGNRKYTDKMTFTFADAGNGQCSLLGCSESQVTSILDFGTNYCNLRALYCGTAEGCKTVEHDFSAAEVKVKTSTGAKHDMALCLTV